MTCKNCITVPTITTYIVLFVDDLDSSSGCSDDEEEPPIREGTRPPLHWYDVGPDSAKETPAWTEREEYSEVDTPIDYFRMFFNKDLLHQITQQSNLYAVQNDPNKPLNMDTNESNLWVAVC